MTRFFAGIAIAATFLLTACGVDGAPERPDRAAPGIAVSGSVSVGVGGSS